MDRVLFTIHCYAGEVMTYVHCHTHSEYSALDGLSTCEEIAVTAAGDGNPAAAITDHGTCAAHPDFQRACDAVGIRPLFGMETYWQPDRTERPVPGDKEARRRLRGGRHLVLIAASNPGLRNLWALSTEAFTTGFYHRPRCDWELLERHAEGMIVTTACLGGIVSRPLLDGDFTTAAALLGRLGRIFPGRLYLEIQGNDIPEQVRLNKLLVMVAAQTGLPLLAASDSHYPLASQASLHKTWMALRTSSANEDYWQIIHMQGEAEVRARLGYLGPQAVDEAVRNSVLLAEQCDARIEGNAEPPVFLGSPEEDSRVLLEQCRSAMASLAGFHGRSRQDYLDRLEDEHRLVASKQLAGCYLVVDDVCRWARSQSILVGPGRGSAAGSLMSYLLGITIADPLETGLMFSRFLTPGRTALPDFDLDFPSSQRGRLTGYVTGKYGEPNVVRVGTNMRYRSRSILNKLFALKASELPPECFADAHEVSAIIDEAESHTAGLGVPWDELMETSTELEPYARRYRAVFETAGRLVGRVHAYGKHPAGLIVSTGAPLAGSMPMRTPSSDDPSLVTQWDFRDTEAQGWLKLDFLTLRTLDSIQEALTLIEQRYGTRPDPAAWRAEYDDPQVWDEISTGHTLGMFQVETSLGSQTCRRMKPRSLAELADINALVRPGPRNSGMAESYLRRRKGREPVTYPHPALAESLQGRFGVMLFQEDILRACIILAGYDGAEADAVRKVLGKKLTEKIEEAGVKFADRCVANGIPRAEARALWAKMAEFGRYAFNLAHAYSYSLLAYWTAWLKVHYPVETLAAICSTLADQPDARDRIAGFVTEARRLGVTVTGPDVNRHARGFATEGITIRYGLDAIKGIGGAALARLVMSHPYESWRDFTARSGVNQGVVYALARAGALDSLVPSRRSLVEYLDSQRSGDLTRCVHKDEAFQGPRGLPCHFDWDSEPVPVRIGKRGKELKSERRPPPARCTRACRNYTPPSPSPLNASLAYSPGELWALEHEIFGTWISPDLFQILDKITPDGRALAREMAGNWISLPPGTYLLPGVVERRKLAHTRAGKPMIWLTLATESSYIDIAVFSPRREDEPDLLTAMRFLHDGTLVVATADRSRYKQDGIWKMSSRLQAIRRLG
jgi:DNA polymerase III subunit alpha